LDRGYGLIEIAGHTEIVLDITSDKCGLDGRGFASGRPGELLPAEVVISIAIRGGNQERIGGAPHRQAHSAGGLAGRGQHRAGYT
jgi:hypothetical protein